METIFPSLPHFLAACAIMALAQCVYVLFGFGAGLISVGTLALLLPSVSDVVVVLLLVCLPSEAGVVARSWKKISWRGTLGISLGVGAGALGGTWLLSRGEPTVILRVLAVFLILAGAAFLLLPDRAGLRWPRWVGPTAGLTSGVLAGLFGTGGPPLILYYRLAGLPKAAFRGSLMAIFLLMTVVRLPAYAWTGLITPVRLWSALAILPAALIGAWLGHRIHLELSERLFRRLVSGALIVLGLLLLGS